MWIQNSLKQKNAVPAFTLKRRSVVVSENTLDGKAAAEKVEEIIKMVFENPKLLKYREQFGLNT